MLYHECSRPDRIPQFDRISVWHWRALAAADCERGGGSALFFVLSAALFDFPQSECMGVSSYARARGCLTVAANCSRRA